MELKNCKDCGRMFNYVTGEYICPACREAQEGKFQEVKKFVIDNRSATMNEICEACEVDVKMVKKWVREERLVFTKDSPVKINCEMCGTQIVTGRYCDRCRKNAANSFGNVVKAAANRRQDSPSEDRSGGIRMHIRDK